jgi:hypothetical protein
MTGKSAGFAPLSIQVDVQVDFGRLQHRQVGGLLSLENAAGIESG